ncbi:MAG TPA: H-X9-DG-CTERM domain-containing protein [Armatimonadota bacterium]|jgi:prepilin-type processing-associated H-X9-DG protein|nr:H-X9-DG-CTERM domain-containing protein [Armatimonadota bacterium]
MVVVGLILVVIPLVVAGCTNSSQEVAEPPAPTTDTPRYEGTWGMVVGTITLEPDGTGRAGAIDGEAVDVKEILWREEGDHLVIEDYAGGRETTARLSEDGSCLVWDHPEDRQPYSHVLIRLESQAMEHAARMADAFDEAMELARERAEQASCIANIKQISLATLMYVQDYDEHYPPAGADTHDATYPYVKNEGLYGCPSDTEAPSYQLNAALLGRRERDLVVPGSVVMVFESDDGEAVANRHSGGANYGFADGHATWMRAGAEDGPNVLWEVGPPR